MSHWMRDEGVRCAEVR
ncbi:hypothetical protein E2C01_101576 [Portunus trituberculatus]|uniref:Uncharacterized protein n=1 Tax=Portunus trituberculatus TaxID=210409 RepID=A0A5B7KKC4_PORTR|nr:hypothetical protein [Portunus trituberculatus]